MTVALLFPGQGEDIVRTGPAWLDAAAVRGLLAHAAAVTGTRGGADALFARGGRALETTAVLQPAMVALCLGIAQELADGGLLPAAVAGHSLGELTACGAAGVLDVRDTVAIAALRGRLMAREAARHPGGMLAVTARERGELDRVLAAAGPAVAVAAHNTTDQWVVSGEHTALREVAAAVAATPLAVDGPWHHPAMGAAAHEYRTALVHALHGPIRTPIISNHTGGLVHQVAELPDLLARQLTHPVQWVRCMATLATLAVTDVVVVGPSRALLGLVRRNLGDACRLHAAAEPADLPNVLGAVGQ